MQADGSSAIRAGPFLIFFKQKLFCACGLNMRSIFDQADMVSQPVPFIDLFDVGAGKRGTFKAKTNLAADGTISYPAPSAIGRLAVFLASAALASPLFPEMRITHGTIHAAGCEHACRNCHIEFHK